MRSEANFRLSECQPRPRLGGSPARVWAFSHQVRARERLTLFEGFPGAGNRGAFPMAGFCLHASSKAASASAVTGVRCSCPVFSCSARHRMVLPSMSMSDHRSCRMAPMRCPVSWAITSATRKRQSISSAALSRASYSASVRSTLAGFFCLGVFRPLRGLDSRRSLPSSSLDLADQLRTASRSLRSYSMVRSDTGRPLGPTLPARRARMNRSQSRQERVAGLRFGPKNLRNIAIAALSYLRDRLALVGVTSSR